MEKCDRHNTTIARAMPLPAHAAGNAVTFHPVPAHAAGGRRASVPQDCRPPGHRPRGWGRRPPPAGHGGRSRKRREASPTQGRAAARVGLARRPLPAGAIAHGVGTAARHPPGQTAGGGSGGKPHPRKAGPPPRAGLGLSLLRPPGPLPTGLGLPPVARRANAHGVGTAALRQPGQTAGAGSGGKPLPRKAGPSPV